MIAIIQRVLNASVDIDNKRYSEINEGLLILLGVTHNDTIEDIEWLSNKIVNLRIFDDQNGTMNLSCIEKKYDILIVSQFTLLARTKKGNRPSYIDSAKPEQAKDLYQKFINHVKETTQLNVKTGVFGADMKIKSVNNGPVTIIIDTKNKK